MVPAAFVGAGGAAADAERQGRPRGLPAPEAGADASAAAREDRLVPLSTPMQVHLGAIWREVLGIPVVSAEDDVLALGANSIHLFQIVARARRSGVEIAAKDLMRHRTIAALATELETRGRRTAEPAGAAGGLPAGGGLPRISQFKRQERRS